MALITKVGGGVRSHSEQAGVTLTSIALSVPGPGFANRILAIYASQTGGTSVQMQTEIQHSASVQDLVGVIVKAARTARLAGGGCSVALVGSKQVPVAIGGNNQQTSINITGNVNDSTETHLIVIADTVRV